MPVFGTREKYPCKSLKNYILIAQLSFFSNAKRMSIERVGESGWIISHPKFFEKMKVTGGGTKPEENGTCSYLTLNPSLFEITEPFKEIVNNVKGKRGKSITICETAKTVKALSDAILGDLQVQEIFEVEVEENAGKIDNCSKDNCRGEKDGEEENGTLNGSLTGAWPKNNFKAVGACQQFFDKVKSLELPHFRGENPIPDSAVMSRVEEGVSSHRYLFPAETKFYCNDVMNMEKVFRDNDEAEFDLIVMDPPWWNKFIRRRKRKQHEAGYEMLDDDGIAKLPIRSILNENGIVAVWCTNAKSHQDKLINEIFPQWGVRHQETLYWLKVTKSRMPICPFNEENKKQPYETIIIGRQDDQCSKCPSEETSRIQNASKVVISVPSSINSHKPPLINVIKQMYPDKIFHRKLEIFARYLVPGFVSYGNEVVKLQHESLYISPPCSIKD